MEASLRSQGSPSPGSDRLLGLFSRPSAASPPSASGGTGVELHEEDVFWTGHESPDRSLQKSPKPNPPASTPLAIPNSSATPRSSFRRLPDRGFAVLAALNEDDEKGPSALIQRKASISSSSASTSPSSTTSSLARMIPTIPKPKHPAAGEFLVSGKVYHQSAPVNIPVAPPMRARLVNELDGVDDDGDEDEGEMLPPHEIVARASGTGSPMTTFSVLEGVGRTLKGRDLRRVRNAVWRKTGLLD